MTNELLIVCPDQQLFSMLKSALSTEFSVHECVTELPTLNKIESISPSLIILDANLFDENPEKNLALFSAGYKTLIYGGDWPAYTEGMSGYCVESAEAVVILEAVKSILKGDIWIKHNLISTVINSLLQRKKDDASKNHFKNNLSELLSGRELEVVERVQTGESNREIADKLCISERTVKAHLSSTFKKLNVPDRLHLVVFLQRYSM
jgi:DNA-binding CsgD family transcriptional regulator